MSVLQDMKVLGGYDKCNLCGNVITDNNYTRMTVYGRSETRKCHTSCYSKYVFVDNSEIFNSTKVRRNGIINRVKISFKCNDLIGFKAYAISCGYTYIRSNQTAVTLISPKFSGCSSVSKFLKKADEKFGIKIVGFTVYNLNDNSEAVITMTKGINIDYTEAIRLFNSNKMEKLFNLVKEKN